MKKKRHEKSSTTRMLIPPKRIVFTGGGLRTLGHYGALEVLEQKGMLKNIKEYIGVSAGAMTGFCLMIGYTITEIQKVVTEFDFTVLQNAHPEVVLDFFSRFGVDSGEQLEKFLCSLLRVKGFPQDITFGQWSSLYPRSPRLRCYACDLNTCQMKEFSLEKTPNASIVFALRASMSLPMYFVPVKDPETDHLLVDGGTIHNFPMNFLTDAEKESALGISFHYHNSHSESISDFMAFLQQVYSCSFNPRTYAVQEANKLQCIIIPTGQMSAYSFDLSKESRTALIENGRKAATEYCDSYLKLLFRHKRPLRRYSVH